MKKELDCRGLQCPKPVMECKELLNAERPDEIVVQVDNMAAVENVTRFLSSNGYKTGSQQIGAALWQVDGIKQGGEASSKTSGDSGSLKTLVLITTETLGRGDDTLGARLMENFLATLPELGDTLWRIVLVNGGVKLASTQGTALDSLKKLAESGVSILVCGTCLMHFGLLEKKEVGETTNMLDIITSLDIAQKVIRP